MLEEFLEHVDDGRGPARGHSLPGAPSVDSFDQLWLDPDVDNCGFPFHTAEVRRYREPLLIIPAKKLISRATVPENRAIPAKFRRRWLFAGYTVTSGFYRPLARPLCERLLPGRPMYRKHASHRRHLSVETTSNSRIDTGISSIT